MRIDRTNFGERKKVLSTSEPFKKYFLAYEGVKTEVNYFNDIRANKKYLQIPSFIELVPLVRNHKNLGLSHPKKVFDIVKNCIEDLKMNSRNLDSLIHAIVDFCFEESSDMKSREDAKNIYYGILNIFENEFYKNEKSQVNFSNEELKEISERLNEYLIANLVNINNLEDFIESQFESFDKEFDEVCLIFDRDKKSFSELQFEQLVALCKENGYKLYITNPCFEFWLLMHFDTVFELDRDKLNQNDKINVNGELINYTELKLREIIPEFKKNNICFDQFKDNLNKAIINSKHFETNLEELKNTIGTNLGFLFEEFIKNANLGNNTFL